MGLVGNLEDLGLGEILQIISFSQKSGKLALTSRSREGYVIFSKGRVVRAESGMLKESTGDMLVQEGVITAQVLDDAINKYNASDYSRNMALILSEDFNVPMEKIDDVVRRRIEKIVYAFFIWSDGNFVFDLDEFEETPEFLHGDRLYNTFDAGVDPQYLSMEGSRIVDEMQRDGTLASASKEGASKDEFTAPSDGVELFDDFNHQDEPVKIESPAAVTQERTVALDDNFASLKDFMTEMGKDESFLADADTTTQRVEESKGMFLLKEMLAELSRPITISEIVLLILRFSSEIFNRTVLFAVKQDNFVGLGEVGVELDNAMAAQVIKKMALPKGEVSIVSDAFNKKRIVISSLGAAEWDKYIISQLGGFVPTESFAAPLMVQGKATMVLYGDNAPGNAPIGDTSSLEIFLGQASMVIERIAMEELASRQ